MTPRPVIVALLPAILALAGTGSVSAQDLAEPSGPSATAALRDGGIRVDGRVDEPAWEAARPVTAFVQGEPVEGAAPEMATEVRVLYDGAALYVGVIMHEEHPERIARQLVRRDERGQYDYFELSLDPNRDRRTGYRFRVGASGVQRDVYLYDDVREDEAWDAVWESAVHVDSLGWSVELRIPLSQIRYSASDAPQYWGVNFTRRRVASNELTYFALESRIRHGRVSVFGALEGLLLPKARRRLEARPYGLSRVRWAEAEPANPFFDGTATQGGAGVDLRYGLTAAHTLDLTINPDFGQVEVDPAVINLTAFETFFPEKRPFFVEDAQIFDFTLAGGMRNRLFYSRRIGREPQRNPPSGYDFTDRPPQTTILGAAKVTGRSPGGLSLGALVSLTALEHGRGADSAGTGTTEFAVEPRTWHAVGRAIQDFRGGATQIGAIVTAQHRALPDDGAFDFLTSRALGFGIDFEHAWGGTRSRDWAVGGFWTASAVHGPEPALIRIQRSSNHYFQRPDATRFRVDSTATALTGLNWRLQLERRSTRNWSGAVWMGQLTPGFEVNDLGFSTASERLDVGARVSYQAITPGRLLRSYRVSVFSFHNFRHEALDDVLSWASWRRGYRGGSVNTNINLEWRNYWRLDLETNYQPEALSDQATRGGPLMTDPSSVQLQVRGASDRRKAIVLAPSLTWSRSTGRRLVRTGLGIELRPTPSVTLELNPSYSTETEPAQYVTATTDAAFTPTFGRRYLFADLDRRSFSLETRVNLTFRPTLTLQLYAQPLISAGDYVRYKQLAESSSFAFDVFEPGTAVTAGDGRVTCSGGRICREGTTQYLDFDANGRTDFTFQDRDFNVRSLRMNAVLRWEYRPGSTLYFVWQQSRSDRSTTGTFALGRDLDALWSAPAENVFIVKLSYWLAF